MEESVELVNKGEISHALDTKIERDREKGVLHISQHSYIDNIVREFNMHEAQGKNTPAPVENLSENDLPITEDEKREAEKSEI